MAGEPGLFAAGRYRVRRFLGEGGKKRVYLAHDTLLDRDVAFALIKSEEADEASQARITREARAMGRLGSHAHIVTVFDLGDEEGRPYIVTEFIGGGTLESLIEDSVGGHVPLERALEIAKAICRGLAFAHERGLVHRDLKPGNVWLGEDGTAKIGDFGLTLPIDGTRLTQEGVMVGTVAYMPPEQALGGEVTARADLYSMGALLYELVTGRPPFLGDDPIAVISQHINTPPVAPSWHNPDCPRALEALILRLLAKDPAARPPSAADVLQALEAVEAAPSAEDKGGPEEAASLDRLAGGVFVGRQREMSELKAALEDALSGRGRLLMLAGEPGIGKTRTALELSTYAGLRRAQVLWGRCYEGEGAPPYWPWVQAIRSYTREHDPQRLRSEMGPGAAEIAEVVSDVRERLPDLGRPPPVDPKQARFRLFDSIAAFLRSASKTQPLVLVLDDLHWADHGSLLLLEFMARELSGARLLVVGTYRDVEVSRRHPLSQTLAELTREGLSERIPLRGLSQEDVGRFIEVTAGISPSAELVGAVHAQTEGNPLFVTEVVRLLVQEGELSAERIDTRRHWSVGIPEGVREVIGKRLDRLSERCNKTLTIAAVVGREFELDQLLPLLDEVSEDRLLEILEEALAARVIEELPRAAGRYQFTHALIQETLKEELSTTRRVRLHAQIADALERLYGDEAEAHAAELAHHLAEAEAVLGAERLVHYSQIAGERALAAHAYEEAAAHFERALAAKEGQPLDGETAALLFGLARAELAAGERYELEGALWRLGTAFDYYALAGDERRAVEVAAHPLPPVYGPSEIPELLSRALRMVPADSYEAGCLLSTAGWFLGINEGDYERAHDAFRRALEIASRRSDPALETRTLLGAAHVEFFHLNWPECLEKSLRAIELAKEAGDQRAEMVARSSATRMLAANGQPEEARAHGTVMCAHAERLRERYWLATAWSDSLWLAMLEGNWPQAREHCDRGLVAQPRDARLLASRVLLEHEVGEFEEAEPYLERLVEAMRLTPRGSRVEYAYAAACIPMVGHIRGTETSFELAKEAGRTLLSAQPRTPLFDRFALIGSAFIAIEQGDRRQAAELYPPIQHAKGIAFVPLGVVTDRLLGLLSLSQGRLDTGFAHLDDALAFCQRAGYRPEYAWTASDYADALLERGSPGDREKAVALQDESLAIARALGMRPLMERILARRQLLQA